MTKAITVAIFLLTALLLGLAYRYVHLINWDLLTKPVAFFDSLFTVLALIFSILAWGLTKEVSEIRLKKIKLGHRFMT